MNWKLIEQKVMTLIERCMMKALLGGGEEWLSAEDLSNRYPMFTKDFIKRHGDLLPRERLCYDDGKKEVASGFMYPAKAIGMMIQRGQFRTAEGTAQALSAWKKMRGAA